MHLLHEHKNIVDLITKGLMVLKSHLWLSNDHKDYKKWNGKYEKQKVIFLGSNYKSATI